MKKVKYYHELTQDEIDHIHPDTPCSEIAKKYPPPIWCGDKDPIHPYGCWSLVGSRRREISREFCKDCDCYIK